MACRGVLTGYRIQFVRLVVKAIRRNALNVPQWSLSYRKGLPIVDSGMNECGIIVWNASSNI
jgi:hypothetical protein